MSGPISPRIARIAVADLSSRLASLANEVAAVIINIAPAAVKTLFIPHL
jgi:hypothetical protein